VIVGTLTTVDTGGAAFLDVRKDIASLGYGVTEPGVEAVDQIEDLAIAIAANIMRGLCGAGWRPLNVAFTRKAPRDRGLFARFFGAPLQFDAARTRLDFPATLLDAPVGAYDAASAGVLAPLLEEAVANTSGGFLSSVKSAIRAQLASGTLSRDRVCVMLDLNARTLAHRLGAYGVSYTGLAEEARYDAARTLLVNGKPLAEIATALGFAEQSAFTRAFKSWSGTTPARWRAENGRSAL
jgi:AraC-like DNA-binding protein